MRRYAAAVALTVSLLMSGRATAWLIQPPPGAAPNAPEAAAEFQRVSADALDAIASLFSALAIAESEHARIDRESMANASVRFSSIAVQYETLSQSNLSSIPLSMETVLQASPEFTADIRIQEIMNIGIMNAADFAIALSQLTNRLAATAEELASNERFGPDDPIDLEGRLAIRRLTLDAALFVRLGNAGALALGLTNR